MSVRNGLLSIVARGTQHGFAIKKAFEDDTGQLWKLNVGQVYTTLTRLARDGLVEELPAGADGADADPAQRRFRITDLGVAELADWFTTVRPPGLVERDELVIKLTMAVSMASQPPANGARPPDPMLIIDEQRRAATAALQHLTKLKTQVESDDIVRLISLDAVTSHIDAEIRWLDMCRARIAADKSLAGQANSHRPTRNRKV